MLAESVSIVEVVVVVVVVSSGCVAIASVVVVIFGVVSSMPVSDGSSFPPEFEVVASIDVPTVVGTVGSMVGATVVGSVIVGRVVGSVIGGCVVCGIEVSGGSGSVVS